MMIEQIINSHHRHSLHENLEFMFGCHHSSQVRRWWITTQCFVDVDGIPGHHHGRMLWKGAEVGYCARRL